MSVKLAPVFNDQTCDSNGNLAVGYKLFTYVAGSVNTKQTAYTDSDGTTPQTNPIILNSLGYPTNGPIWLTAGLNYKFVLTTSTDTDPPTSPVKTIDNISGVNDASISVNQWLASGVTPTYIGTTSFSLAGDQTTEFHVSRRLQFSVTAGTVYGTIASSAYAALTTVTMTMDSAQVLDSGLSAVNLSILRADHSAVPSTYAKSGANADITSLTGLTTPITLSQGGFGLQTINATQASNAMTVSLSPTSLNFRSATLGSGTVNARAVGSTITVVIPSSATLGSTNAVASRIAVLAIDNAGTVELAVINNAGGVALDETGLISTTAISAAATSSSVIYSTTARTSVPYRVVGFFDSTQATAGTWATAPSTIQGAGGRAILPYRQLAQNLTSQTGVYASGTGTFTANNTIPVNTNGDQYLSLAITPTNVNSTLEIDITLFLACSVVNQIGIALYQDTTVNALAAGWTAQPANSQQPAEVSFKHIMTASTTSATTFKVRAGGVSAGTTSINGQSGAQIWGGVMSSRITIKEYLP